MFICAFQFENEDKKEEVKIDELSSLVGHQDKTTFTIRQGLQDEGSYERRPHILNQPKLRPNGRGQGSILKVQYPTSVMLDL